MLNIRIPFAVAIATVDVAALQTRVTQVSSISTLSWVTDRAASAEVSPPIYWMHVPKCGGSLLNALTHVSNICDVGPNHVLKSHQDGHKFDSIIHRQCPGVFVEAGICTLGNHCGLSGIYNAVKGHGVVMLRQPEQRIISAWNNYVHSWPYFVYKRWPANVREFAQAVSGCAVKMLTRSIPTTTGFGYSGSACGDLQPVKSGDASLAVRRLHEGFIFVGLTEQWGLSICLFRKMFGGDCLESDFRALADPVSQFNVGELKRSNWTLISKSSANESLYDTSQLGDFHDVHDGTLYVEAQRMFAEATTGYGATLASCQPCFSQAGYSP